MIRQKALHYELFLFSKKGVMIALLPKVFFEIFCFSRGSKMYQTPSKLVMVTWYAGLNQSNQQPKFPDSLD